MKQLNPIWITSVRFALSIARFFGRHDGVCSSFLLQFRQRSSTTPPAVSIKRLTMVTRMCGFFFLSLLCVGDCQCSSTTPCTAFTTGPWRTTTAASSSMARRLRCGVLMCLSWLDTNLIVDMQRDQGTTMSDSILKCRQKHAAETSKISPRFDGTCTYIDVRRDGRLCVANLFGLPSAFSLHPLCVWRDVHVYFVCTCVGVRRDGCRQDQVR